MKCTTCAGNFGRGANCNSHIEATWSSIKNEIKFLYRIIPHKNYILFICEGENRFISPKLSNSQKEKYFIKVLKCLLDL